jgi:hypothetical protein
VSYAVTLRVVGAGESRPANTVTAHVHGIITFGTWQPVQGEEDVEVHSGPKIAFVGGGSYQWGPKIILDVALNEGSRGGTLVLHDINVEALEDMFDWGQKAIEQTNADLRLEKTLRLEEALRGADFVIFSISTGGWTPRRWTWRSPPVTGWCRPWATPWGPVDSFGVCETSLWSSRLPAQWRGIVRTPYC